MYQTHEYTKRFPEWLTLKANLHGQDHEPPHVSERDLWWASLGENIGSEVNGKSKQFSRPVVILKKLARGFYLVVPTTTQDKKGSWYVSFTHQDVLMVACLHQIRTIDHKRLWSRLGRMDTADFKKLKRAFFDLYR